MDDFDVEENLRNIATGGNSDDEMLTTNQLEQTQIKVSDPSNKIINRELNTNAHSHISTHLPQIRTSNLYTSNRASTPRFQTSNNFFPDTYPQLTRYPLPYRVPQPRAIHPSNRFDLPGGRPSYPQHSNDSREAGE